MYIIGHSIYVMLPGQKKEMGGCVQRVTPHPKLPITNKENLAPQIPLKEYSHSFRHRPHPSARFRTNARFQPGLSLLNSRCGVPVRTAT